MIADLFCSLRDSLQATGFFSVVYEFVEKQQVSSEKNVPRYYSGGGFKDVQNFDVNGVAYMRKTGRVNYRPYAGVKTTSCGAPTLVEITYPARLVCAVLRSKISEDSPFVDDLLAVDMIGVIQVDMTAQVNGFSSSVAVTGYETDGVTIWNQENQGVSYNEATLFKFAYIAIDFNILISGDVECLQNCLAY